MKRFTDLTSVVRVMRVVLCMACVIALAGCTAVPAVNASTADGSSITADDTGVSQDAADSIADTAAQDTSTETTSGTTSGPVSGADGGAGEDASSNVSADAAEMEFTDMIGRKLMLTPGSYKNVVCIGAGALRIYSYVGNMDLLCGVEDIDNLSLKDRPKMFDTVARPYMLAYAEDLKGLPSCGVGGPNAQAAEAEKILSCSPDIVISEYKDVEKEDALQEQLGVPVVTMSAGKDGVFDDNFKQSLRLLGTIFENESRAEEIISFIDSQVAEISNRTKDVEESDKPSVYICGLGNWGTTDHLTTAEEFKAFEIAHIKNAISGMGIKGVQPIEEEKFVAIGDDIDIMIIDSAAVKNIAPLYQEDNTILDSCRAWRDGNVYLQMAYNAYYTNFELSLMNTWFAAKMVYPELFEDIDMNEKSDEITAFFLGQPLSDKINSCPSSYGGYQKIDTASFFAN